MPVSLLGLIGTLPQT